MTKKKSGAVARIPLHMSVNNGEVMIWTNYFQVTWIQFDENISSFKGSALYLNNICFRNSVMKSWWTCLGSLICKTRYYARQLIYHGLCNKITERVRLVWFQWYYLEGKGDWLHHYLLGCWPRKKTSWFYLQPFSG